MTQPRQDIGHGENLTAWGQDGPVYHHNRHAQFARSKQLGLCARSTRVFRNDAGDLVSAHQLQITLNGERPTVCHHDIFRKRQGSRRRINKAQQVEMLGVRCELLKVHAPDSQHNPFTRSIQRSDGRRNIRHIDPVVTFSGLPRRAGQSDHRDIGDSACLHGIQAHLAGKGMGRIDQMRDLVLKDIAGKPLRAAKATDALRKRVPDRARHAASQRNGASKPRLVKRLAQQVGLGCAAKDQGFGRMGKSPWLSIVGLGENGADGLCSASLNALERAEIVMGAARHLDLLPEVSAEKVMWPVPFSDGIKQLLSFRGQRVVVLASGDPFWFGAGTSVSCHLSRDEWIALPNVSTFAMAASEMGWALEKTHCFGLHAAPFTRLRPVLARGVRLIVLLRDGAAVAGIAQYLAQQGWGESQISVLEALGGPRARRSELLADDAVTQEFTHPVCVAIEVAGAGDSVPLAAGRPDALFASDGTMTKRPVRALTLSALAPRPFQHLWDIGGGSGSIAIEWLLSDPSLSATTIEPNPERAARIIANAAALGVDRLDVVQGYAPQSLEHLAVPDIVFIGGGLSADLLAWLEGVLPKGTRLVANAVTLESEVLLVQARARCGGDLMRIDLSNAAPLGAKHGWKASYPIVQWSVTL